jgi:RNA polymerase sigma factor (sigma-70 family)
MMRQQQDLSMLENSPIAVLYERESLTIFRYIMRRVALREDAEDILLEVFLAALESESLAQYNEEKQRAWLLRVAHNKIIDHYRYASIRSGTIPLEEITETAYVEEDGEPDKVVLQDEEYALLRSHMQRLPALQQEVLQLRFYAGLRHAEIANRLNKREGTIRVLLTRSLQFLRNLYKHP